MRTIGPMINCPEWLNRRLRLFERYLAIHHGLTSIEGAPVVEALHDALRPSHAQSKQRRSKRLRVKKQGKLIIHDFTAKR